MGFLSAIFTNDVICLTASPIIIETCLSKDLNPIPYLIGLACASNIGSSLTVIGNPQNILIAQTLHLSFYQYTKEALPAVLLGILLSWAIVFSRWRSKWAFEFRKELEIKRETSEDFDLKETLKGLVVATGLVIFLLVIGGQETFVLFLEQESFF